MDIRALIAFTDPRTERVYQPGDFVAGLSRKRAEVYARHGLVVIGSDGLRSYKYPALPVRMPTAIEVDTLTAQLDIAQLELEYDQRYRDNPEKWANTPERNEMAFQTLSQYFDHEPTSVIDVGCGNGHTLAYLQKKWPGAALFGLDLSEEGLKLAEVKVPGMVPIHSALENWEKAPKFDVVICLGTAEHFPNLLESLRQLKRLIGPEGYGYIEVPHNLLYSPGEIGFRRLGGGSRQWEWHLERASWEMMLFEAGLEIVGAYTGSREMWEYIWVVK